MATEKRLVDANLYKKMLDTSLEGTYGIEDSKAAGAIAGTIIACGCLLEQLPTVDAVEVVRGHWIYGTRAAVCSECGFERHLDDNFGRALACPNCRAFMD